MKHTLLSFVCLSACIATAQADKAAFVINGYSAENVPETHTIVSAMTPATALDGVATLSFSKESTTAISNGQLSLKADNVMSLTPADGVTINSVTIRTLRAISATAQGNINITPAADIDYTTAFQASWSYENPAGTPVTFTGANVVVRYVEFDYTNDGEPQRIDPGFKFATEEVSLVTGSEIPLPAWTPADVEADRLTFSITPAGIITISGGNIIAHSPGTAYVSVSYAGNDKYLPAAYADALVVTVTTAPSGFEWSGVNADGIFTADKAKEDIQFPELINSGTFKPYYSSSDTEVATIDSETGDITLISKGETIITAAVADASGYTPAAYTLVVIDTSSGIDSAAADIAPARYHDLQGRAVTGTLQPGLYIVSDSRGTRKVFIR